MRSQTPLELNSCQSSHLENKTVIELWSQVFQFGIASEHQGMFEGAAGSAAKGRAGFHGSLGKMEPFAACLKLARAVEGHQFRA